MSNEKFYELNEKKELMKMISDNKNSVSNIFNEFADDFCKDPDVIWAIQKNSPMAHAIQRCKGKIKKDREFNLQCVKDYDLNLHFVDKKFKTDSEFVRTALFEKSSKKRENFDRSLELIDSKFKETKEFKDILKNK